MTSKQDWRVEKTTGRTPVSQFLDSIRDRQTPLTIRITFNRSLHANVPFRCENHERIHSRKESQDAPKSELCLRVKYRGQPLEISYTADDVDARRLLTFDQLKMGKSTIAQFEASVRQTSAMIGTEPTNGRWAVWLLYNRFKFPWRCSVRSKLGPWGTSFFQPEGPCRGLFCGPVTGQPAPLSTQFSKLLELV